METSGFIYQAYFGAFTKHPTVAIPPVYRIKDRSMYEEMQDNASVTIELSAPYHRADLYSYLIYRYPKNAIPDVPAPGANGPLLNCDFVPEGNAYLSGGNNPRMFLNEQIITHNLSPTDYLGREYDEAKRGGAADWFGEQDRVVDLPENLTVTINFDSLKLDKASGHVRQIKKENFIAGYKFVSQEFSLVCDGTPTGVKDTVDIRAYVN